MAAGRISQLEMAFAPNIDGDLILGNPRDRVLSGDVKDDLGFYLHEVGRNEGETMVKNLFGNAAFKATLYGDNAAVLFQELNSYILVPKLAFDGLITTYITDPTLQGLLLAEDALGCPLADGDATGGLLTECAAQMSDFITSWMWTCNTAHAFSPYMAQASKIPNLYAVEFHAAKPGPGSGEEGVQLPDIPEMSSCYEATEGKSCHIEGQAYLFGESANQGTVMTAAESLFGQEYRALYSELIKTGSSSHLVSFESSGGLFNKIDIGTRDDIEQISVFANTCAAFDLMNAYGLM